MAEILTSTRFKLVRHPDDPSPVAGPDPNRNIHVIARITTGLRDFIVMQDFNNYNDVWIEESTGGTIAYIEDDELWKDLYEFIKERGVLTFIRID
jgi:hypothetical protein